MSDSDTRDQKAGGVSTMPRPAAPPRRTARPRPPAEPGRRPGLPDGVRLAPSAPSTPSAPSASRGGHRMPFILMLCVLLGGALVCTLLISTTLAAGSYRITKLQQSVDALARQRQTLQEQVAQAQSAQVIEQQAEQLGMGEPGQLRFFNLKTGKVQTDAGSGAVQAINVPGYTP
ncbi:MAG TPA: hypothetical protein VFE26_14960 [Trebonia sp.]|nr:hypothetical protein [Trebonia sp.]